MEFRVFALTVVLLFSGILQFYSDSIVGNYKH